MAASHHRPKAFSWLSPEQSESLSTTYPSAVYRHWGTGGSTIPSYTPLCSKFKKTISNLSLATLLWVLCGFCETSWLSELLFPSKSYRRNHRSRKNEVEIRHRSVICLEPSMSVGQQHLVSQALSWHFVFYGPGYSTVIFLNSSRFFWHQIPNKLRCWMLKKYQRHSSPKKQCGVKSTPIDPTTI